MIISFKKWCVYYHYIEDTCIWVGSGRPRRPYDGGEVRRNLLWNQLVKKNNFEIDVRIVKWFISRREARTYEDLKIKELHPICNLLGNGWKRKVKQETIKKFKETIKNRSKKRTDQWKKNASNSAKKRPPVTEETRKKMSESGLRRNLRPGAFRKNREAQLGRKHSLETRIKISIGHFRRKIEKRMKSEKQN